MTGAFERSEPWGVWDGEIFDRGVIVAHKRRPGRPRKHLPGKHVHDLGQLADVYSGVAGHPSSERICAFDRDQCSTSSTATSTAGTRPILG
jgi:hypothetical protein